VLLVILTIAALAILAGVVLVSLGKGGELTEFPPDVPPLNLPEASKLTAVDFMALQLPVNLVGYHTQSVDETLRRASEAISARDTRIAILEQRVSELLSSRLHARQEIYAAPGDGPRTEHEPPAAPLALPAESDPLSNGHVPCGAWEEPPSPEHKPVTWGEPDAEHAAAEDAAAEGTAGDAAEAGDDLGDAEKSGDAGRSGNAEGSTGGADGEDRAGDSVRVGDGKDGDERA
jgi:hypothetical protein